MSKRKLIPIGLAIATALAGCHSPSSTRATSSNPPAASPSCYPMFVTTPGTHTSPDGLWQVVASPTGDSLDLTQIESSTEEGRTRSAFSTVHVPGWTAKAGWFVFIESTSRVWAYDGERQLCLNTETSGHGEFYHGPHKFPCAVPAQVFSRLSEPAQRVIEKR